MNKKFEKMKTTVENRIKKNTALLACVTIFTCVSATGVVPVQLADESAKDFVSGFQLGLLCTLLIAFLTNVVKYRKALKDEKLLKKIYYTENDERLCYINQQVGRSSMTITTVILVIATVITGYFDFTVFVTMLAVTAFQAVIQLVLIWYYTNCVSGNDTEEE